MLSVKESFLKRSISIGLALLFVITAFSILVPVTEEADGWTSGNMIAEMTENSVYVSATRYQRYDGMYPSNFYSSSLRCGRASQYNYRAFISFDISGLNDNAYIYSGSLVVYVDYVGYIESLNAYLMGPGDYTDYGYNDLSGGRYIGSYNIAADGTRVFTLDNNDLQIIRNSLKNGEDRICIGFRSYETTSSTSSYRYVNVLCSSSSYLSLRYDQSAPPAPTLDELDEYTEGNSVSVEWNSVSDNPTGGSYGQIRYQAGVFDNEMASEPIYTSPWSSSTSYTFNSLADGQEYHFRVKAKDGLDFESSWSPIQSTTMDSTPPTTPGLFVEPAYTQGTENTIIWSPSEDTASGIDYYAAFVADNPMMTGAFGALANDNYYTFTGLTSGTIYYYVVYAMDNMGHRSQLSPMESSMQDDTVPSVPVLMREPAYTLGDKNRFEWHPSNDIGIGVANYSYEVATSEDFSTGSIVDHGTVAEPFFTARDLIDGTRYWARVKARDGFGHESEWSRSEWSIQDMSGPGELGLKNLEIYSPDEPVDLDWNAAEDVGSGTGWYKVIWSMDPTFNTGVFEIDHVVGHSYTISGLDTGSTWYFKVVSYDSLGNEGETEETLTTIDAMPPTVPIIANLPEHSGGRSNLISWSESTDALSGLDHYILNVYTSPDRIGMAFWVHTTETEFEVPGLSDGTIYYYEVISYDRAGNMIGSALKHSTQDTMGPSIPHIHEMDDYYRSSLVPVSWEPSVDEGAGLREYEVELGDNELFSREVHRYRTSNTNLMLYNTYADSRADGEFFTYPLEDGIYFVHVRSIDNYGQFSSFSPLQSFVIDTERPDTPILENFDTYWGNGKAMVSWNEVNDDDDIEYQVQVLDDEESTDPIMTSIWTSELEKEVLGLEAGRTYWVSVVARDVAGIISGMANSKMIMMDNTPPRFTIDKGGIFGGTDKYLSGEAEDTQCGMDSVQISFDEGLTWEDCQLNEDQWSFSMGSVPPDTSDFMVRAMDLGGNIGDSIRGVIDLSDPVITITYPAAYAEVSGPVQLMGSIVDDNLESYKIEYQGPDSNEWVEIAPMQTTSGFSGILGTWLTSGLSGGEYTIRVTATDDLGQTSTQELIVEIGGTNILLDPSMVSFSNSHPVSGDEVTVFLTLTNLGESPAEGLTITLYDGEQVIGSSNEITVPARGSVIVTGSLKAEGTHMITARVSSGDSDDIIMTEAAVLETTEDEMVMENIGGILALIALILAIIAIIIAVFLGLRKGKDDDKAEPKEAEIRESPIDDGQRRPSSLSGGSTSQRPELPMGQPPQKMMERRALPSPTIAPVSMPKKDEKPEPKPAPKAAPMQAPPRSDPVQYMAPENK